MFLQQLNSHTEVKMKICFVNSFNQQQTKLKYYCVAKYIFDLLLRLNLTSKHFILVYLLPPKFSCCMEDCARKTNPN